MVHNKRVMLHIGANRESALDRVASNIPIFKQYNIGGVSEKVLMNFSDLYVYVRTLGQGGSGTVKCYTDKISNVNYAIKEIPVINSTNISELKDEVEVLKTLSSPYTVKYYDSFLAYIDDMIKFIIITEHIEGVSLQRHIDNIIKADITIKYETLLKFGYWLFDALDYIHKRGYVHRDIKPGNIMVDINNNRFVLIDFGLSCSIESKNKVTCKSGEFLGTTVFMPPESLIDTETIDAKQKILNIVRPYKLDKLKLVDIWAAGITLYFLAELSLPWEAGFSSAIRSEIKSSREIDYNRSLELKQILDLALKKNPQERYQADYIRDVIADLVK